MDAGRTLRLLGMTCSLIEVPDLDLGSVFAAYDELRRLIESPQHGPGQVFELWEKLRRSVASWKARIQLRSRQDAFDENGIGNSRILAEVSPVLDAYDAEVKTFFLSPGNREHMKSTIGNATLSRWKADVIAVSPAIQDELTSEAALTDEYFQLIGKMRTSMRGEKYSLAQLASFAEDADRCLRREANEASWNALNASSSRLDSLFDELVRCRTSMAQRLGYNDYVGLSYKRLGRVDYGPREVAVFRNEIRETIVPLAAQFASRQAQELGVESLMPWDEALYDTSPPRAPRTAQELMTGLSSVAAAIHPEFATFMADLTRAGLMDLSERSGKAGGAFCAFFPDLGMPFVFASYTGTFRSARSIIHELGHAFQDYRSRDYPVLDQIVPTSEIGEIHSMALELLICPFYKALLASNWEQCLKYELRYLVSMLPYIAAIDGFQELVYSAPTATAADRLEMWLQMEKQYLPGRRSGGILALESGRRWQRQRHVYAAPFLYIDYGLAICCALQLWLESNDNPAAAMEKWVDICSLGGTLSMTALLNRVSLKSPFHPGALSEVVSAASKIA